MARIRRSLLFEMHLAGQLVYELVAREYEQRGLKIRGQALLEHIHRRGPITPTELERETGLRPSTLRERMQPLLNDGLVHRVPSAEDKRSHRFEITTRGRDVLAEAWPAVVAADRALQAALGYGLEEHRALFEEIVRAGQSALAERSAETATH